VCGRQHLAGLGNGACFIPSGRMLEHGTANQPMHWAKHYAPVLTMAVQLPRWRRRTHLGPRPTCLDACPVAANPPGSRMRQIDPVTGSVFAATASIVEGFAGGGGHRPMRASMGLAWRDQVAADPLQ